MSDSLQDHVVAALGDHYKVEREIGRGGMSVVFKARDARLNRAVAIKVLPPELTFDPAIRTRFTREAQTSAQLAHPHIVPIFDVGERDGIAYFVMAHVAGGNLATLLALEPRLPVDEVRRLLSEMADALAYAHLRGVIHRDIKPDNVLLDEHTGRATLTDFGIARAIEGGSRLTLSGITVGTPTYMSPEQAMGDREVDGRSDIYSLGVVAYQMLTGRVPFSAGNSMALLLKHVTETPRPIAELRPEAPRALCEVIERALAKDPEDRWPTAESLRDALASDRPQYPSWRSEQRESVRYSSPNPERSRRGEQRSLSARRAAPVEPVEDNRPRALEIEGPRGPIVLEQEHLVSLMPEQRDDLRLWHGRVHLKDRVKAARGYLWFTLVMAIAGFAGLIGAFEEEIPPLVLAPIVPIYMTAKLWRRGKSLRKSGLRLRRVFLMPRAKWVIPKPPPPPPPPPAALSLKPAAVPEQELERLAPRDVLAGDYGTAIRRAAQDRAVILDVIGKLPAEDKALIPDVAPTVKALVDRVANLAQLLHRVDQGIDPRLGRELDLRIADAERRGESPDDERGLALLLRQRDTLRDLADRRAKLERQLDSAGLALVNLRLDLIKLRSHGLNSVISNVSSATQEARALSREIGAVLDAADEVRSL